MTYVVSLTREAVEDLGRLESFLLDAAAERGDWDLPSRAMRAIRQEFRILERNPFTCRIALDDRFERELVIPFGSTGYVALFRILSETEVVISAIRHQREDGYD
ncbi:MAG: type II toxin-antitoxin system RelE/ParE family toxin [Ottowia sp.]|uniref:type II toxin-antitoxin system RelE/ParE family toxin n=1 Tax=unclassified Ottowia TaxID=2645081 RepID=UPI003C2CE062